MARFIRPPEHHCWQNAERFANSEALCHRDKLSPLLAPHLKARYVIHTVGPVWQGGKVNEPQILESCYCNSMEQANMKACTSVSFPSISTGAFGYPVAAAAQIALRVVADLLHDPKSVKLVRFVLFDQRTYKAYATAAEELSRDFPNYQIKAEA